MARTATRFLNQKAVLYAYSGNDNYGQPTVAAAAEISCRREQGNKEEVDAQGTVIGISIEIFVDQTITIGSLIVLGELADLPSPVTDIFKVENYNEIPDRKGRTFERVVTCSKYGNTLPS